MSRNTEYVYIGISELCLYEPQIPKGISKSKCPNHPIQLGSFSEFHFYPAQAGPDPSME